MIKFRAVKAFLLLLLAFSLGFQARSQEIESPLTVTEKEELPRIFLIGEYEEAFEMLSHEYGEILLSVCADDMDFAYEKWMDMLAAAEDYADRINFDVKGLKLYMYVFWNEDGSVAHLAYFPKTNSRNIPLEEITAFFNGFVKDYRMPVNASQGFSHYASAAFPVFFRPEYKVYKD